MSSAEDRSRGRRRHGALREEVLGLLVHASKPLTGRQVVEALTTDGESTPALTTVLTVLDRLHRTGEVDKYRSETGDLLFAATRHEPQVVAGDMLDALLRSNDRTGALLSFAGGLTTKDLEALTKVVGAPRGTEGDARS